MNVDILEEKVFSLIKNYQSSLKAKTEAMKYIMENAELKVFPNEMFAYSITQSNIMLKVHYHLHDKVLESDCEPSNTQANFARKIQAFDATLDFGHIAPDWKFLLDFGIPGTIKRLKEYREKYSEDEKKQEFYNNSISLYQSFQKMLLRMAEVADKNNTPESDFCSKNLRAIANSAPETLGEAMQFILIYYMVQTNLEQTTVRSLGGLDRLLMPFFENDLKTGRFSESELRKITSSFLYQINTFNVIANLPFYIGGRYEDGSDATNYFTQIILEEYRALDIHDPKMHVMYHKDMNTDIVTLILEMIREGKNSFVFINTDVVSKALKNIGVSEEDSKKVIIYGCYEAAAEATEVPCTCGGRINLAKAVELALFNGTNPKTNEEFSPKTGDSFKTFDEFLRAVKEQLRYITENCMNIISDFEHHYNKICPSPLMSATYKNSVESGTDIYDGGAKYNNTSIVAAGIATLTDSLVAIKNLVFDNKLIQYDELKKCLLNNWKGFDELLSYILNSVPKYANNNSEADSIAEDIFSYITDLVNNKPNSRGGVFRFGMFSVDWRIGMGSQMIATPDGRLEGEPISKNAAASIGQDKNGVTAYLNTLLKFDSCKIPDGCVADVVLHSSAAAGTSGMTALKGLLLAYMNSGGFAVHFNVLNSEILKKAQKEPEKYKNLQIRLCGWNAYFVSLSKQVQDEFILQSSNKY